MENQKKTFTVPQGIKTVDLMKGACKYARVVFGNFSNDRAKEFPEDAKRTAEKIKVKKEYFKASTLEVSVATLVKMAYTCSAVSSPADIRAFKKAFPKPGKPYHYVEDDRVMSISSDLSKILAFVEKYEQIPLRERHFKIGAKDVFLCICSDILPIITGKAIYDSFFQLSLLLEMIIKKDVFLLQCFQTKPEFLKLMALEAKEKENKEKRLEAYETLVENILLARQIHNKLERKEKLESHNIPDGEFKDMLMTFNEFALDDQGRMNTQSVYEIEKIVRSYVSNLDKNRKYQFYVPVSEPPVAPASVAVDPEEPEDEDEDEDWDNDDFVPLLQQHSTPSPAPAPAEPIAPATAPVAAPATAPAPAPVYDEPENWDD
jgi:hypothetical protein